METRKETIENVLFALKERAKELNCLYEVEELFNKPQTTLDEICHGIIRAIPAGWQYPDICKARIILGDRVFIPPGFVESPWAQSADLIVQDERLGSVSVYYNDERPAADEGPFLKEERRLVNTIAERLGRRVLHERLMMLFETGELKKSGGQWSVIITLLRQTDPRLLSRLARKMLNHLSWLRIEEADRLLAGFSRSVYGESGSEVGETNRPSQTGGAPELLSLSETIFQMAGRHLSDPEIFGSIQKWIREDRSGFLVKTLEDPATSLEEIGNSLDRFHHMETPGGELSPGRERGLRVSLIRRLLSDQPLFINIAERHTGIDDFLDLLRHIIGPARSHGRLGGKGAGLFLAGQILKTSARKDASFPSVRIPKTWYVASDGIIGFINHNDLEDIVEQKYEDINRVRAEYPYIVHVFKKSALPPEIVNGLSVALEDFGDTPLIVRSSSLLEDRVGTSFAGKYKSLFIANQGTKRERLDALVDAIAEVYASTFGPDPIGYRMERGLIDFHEEMGVLIQAVVGTKVGHFFFPAFAGVAFSRNEFRWSRRLRSTDGLLRMVPGLGTRAVDRVSDDYPILVAPGQPELRVNVTVDEQVRYSPRKIDVINLKTNSFETVEIRALLKDFGDQYPLLNRLTSVVEGDRLREPADWSSDERAEKLVMTFDGLIRRTPIIAQVMEVMTRLQEELQMPVDLEFAHDGKEPYLVQCRPQSFAGGSQPPAIPRDFRKEMVLFTANRYITNGVVSDLTHIVYVDPHAYSELASADEMLSVGKAVARLNEVLPRRRFILMGPGRWGSRGDIRLGVSVSYSDIHNAAMLVEIARRKADYLPEVSFGTHFFQDLVEEAIRYLPLYPDDEGVIFNERFLIDSPNVITALAPEFSRFEKVVRVIDVKSTTGGRLLQVLMNDEVGEAVGFFAGMRNDAAAG